MSAFNKRILLLTNASNIENKRYERRLVCIWITPNYDKSTGNSIALDTRLQAWQIKRWIDNVVEDIHQRGSDLPCTAAQCTSVKDRKQVSSLSCILLNENGPVKESLTLYTSDEMHTVQYLADCPDVPRHYQSWGAAYSSVGAAEALKKWGGLW